MQNSAWRTQSRISMSYYDQIIEKFIEGGQKIDTNKFDVIVTGFGSTYNSENVLALTISKDNQFCAFVPLGYRDQDEQLDIQVREIDSMYETWVTSGMMLRKVTVLLVDKY